MVKAYIGLGSNLGERYRNIEKAITFLERTPGIKVNRYSSFYETEPVGYKDQPWFINCVLEIETKLSAPKLLENLLEIEKKLGRKRRIKWSPRIIDLDILFYGGKIIKEKDLPRTFRQNSLANVEKVSYYSLSTQRKVRGLSIPHPRLNERKFVLVPLNEINPRIYHPVFKKTIHQLLNDLKNNPEQVIQIPALHKIRSGPLITLTPMLHRGKDF